MDFSGELGFWKPNSQIFHHTLSKLGVASEEAVFVGDSPHDDIVGAQGVGMRAIWMRSADFPLGDVRPDALIEALPELHPILQRWRA
jgi:FMN phosphatase YigB (HAD superfamily)